MPVLAVGGAASFGPTMATVMRAGAIDVEEQVIAGSGHWLMEEQPAATIAAIENFLDARPAALADGQLAPAALTLEQTQALKQSGAGTGTSGVSGIRTVLLSGDPAKAGPYVLEIHVPPNTAIAPHTHRDDRFATVISGTWYFGYGRTAAGAAVKPLTAGALYTEPSGTPHFAMTRAEGAVVRLTGNGPSDTSYLTANSSH
jgi:quercetin dioxygenase-like cupin family protein